MNTVDFSSFLPLIVIFGAMYFFVIRPQSKKAKEHKEMLGTLKVGDRVLTTGGFLGNIKSLSETEAVLEIAPNVPITIVRGTISQKIPAAESKPKAPQKAASKPAKPNRTTSAKSATKAKTSSKTTPKK